MGGQFPNRRLELSRTGRLQQFGEWFRFTAGSAFLQWQSSAIVNEQPLLCAAAADISFVQQPRLRTAKVQRRAVEILLRPEPRLFGALSLLFGSIALLLGAEPELLRPKPQLQRRWRWWRQLQRRRWR